MRSRHPFDVGTIHSICVERHFDRGDKALGFIPNQDQTSSRTVQGGKARANIRQSNAASLAATSAKTNYITGFDLSGGGATAASVIEVTVTGLASGAGTTLKYEVAIAAGVTAPAFGTAATNAVYSIRFPQPLPASATNTAITVTCPSFGAGNTNASVCVYGYQK